MLKTLPLPRHLGMCFLLQIYEKGRQTQLSYVYLKHQLQQTTQNSNDLRPTDYLCCISFRNMNCYNGEIRV